MPSELKKFQEDLLESVKQMRRGRAARISKVRLSAVAEARASVGLSQQEFAVLLGGRRERCKTGSKVAASPLERHARYSRSRSSIRKSFASSKRDA